MAMGEGSSRESWRSRSSGGGSGLRRPTVREVCLLGMDRYAREAWQIGQAVTWLGRGYRVVSGQLQPDGAFRAPGAESGCTSAVRIKGGGRYYVYLAACPCDEATRAASGPDAARGRR
jgi:hypothetical protein